MCLEEPGFENFISSASGSAGILKAVEVAKRASKTKVEVGSKCVCCV